MSGHAFARVSGFGRTLTPFTPCRYQQLPGAEPALHLRYLNPAGVKGAVVYFRGGEPEVEPEEGTAALAEVAELSEGPDYDHWKIETALFRTRWPAAFAFYSSGERTPPVFDLLGPEGAMIWVQGPFPPEKLPALHDLGAPGQTVRDQGETADHSWIEFDYLHEGAAWRQRQYLAALWENGSFLLVTTQAPERQADLTAAAVDEVVGSFEPPP